MASSLQPKHPSTLAPVAYYDGLVDRLTTALLPVLEPYFTEPTTHRVLELASGNGTHAALYAQTWPAVVLQPTECDEYGCAEVDRTAREKSVQKAAGEKGGVRKAVLLDVLEDDGWRAVEEALEKEESSGAKGRYDLVVGSNFLHMVPFPEGPRSIFSHLLPLVSLSARFIVYGPFKSDEGFFSKADEDFDNMIRARPNGSYLGLRSIDALARLAAEEGWELEKTVDMPKGNWVLVFKRKNSD
ncbi:hypothetical protein JCM10213_002965 [Rhodosporidiobolus nylandii]